MVWPTELDEKLGEFNAMDLPGQQLSASQASTPLDHLLNLDIKSPPGCQRLTGIIAHIVVKQAYGPPNGMQFPHPYGRMQHTGHHSGVTNPPAIEYWRPYSRAGTQQSYLAAVFCKVEVALPLSGKSTNDVEILEKMIAAGMNIALLNLSFGTKDEHVEHIKTIKQAAKNYSITMGRMYPLAIAASLPGRKIRTGKIADTYGEAVELKTNEVVRLTTDESYSERCSTYTVYVDFMHFADQLKKNDLILLDNESILLKVEIISSTTLTCKIERGGFLGSYKDVFVPNVIINMPNYTDKDKIYIDMAIHHQIDILVASFVNNASAITELRGLLGEKGKKIAIIANIQTIQGYHNFDEILEVTNGVMITRQELGSDITPKKLVIAQKNMIARANMANISVCISAQLLSSMKNRKLPLRAELLDIANCILDGVDALVLSAETAVGLYPVETVSCLASACKEAEACVWSKQIYHDLIDKTPMPCDQVAGTALAAVLAAHRTIAAAIVVVTSTGHSAKVVSKYKPRCPIIGVTRYPIVAKQLHLWRGVIPLVYEEAPDADWLIDLDQRVQFCLKWAMEHGFIRVSDPIVIVSSWKQGSGYTNTMRIVNVAPDT